MGTWQPIETAPKDGTWILVFSTHGEIPAVARWSDEFRYWSEFEDWQEANREGEDESWGLTHWQPLPEPPADD